MNRINFYYNSLKNWFQENKAENEQYAFNGGILLTAAIGIQTENPSVQAFAMLAGLGALILRTSNLGTCAICQEKVTFWQGSWPHVVNDRGLAHRFHIRCIVPWFQQGHFNCPSCRAEVVPPTDLLIQEGPVSNEDLDDLQDLVERGRNSEHIRGLAVIIATLEDELEIVQALLAQGNISDRHHRSAVLYAVENRYAEILETLLVYRGISEADCEVSLSVASENGYREIVRILLEHRTISDHGRGVSVLKAAENGHLDILKSLLASGTISNHHRDLSVFKAVQNGHLEIVPALMENGPISEEIRELCVQIAISNGDQAIVPILRGQ